MLHEPRRLVRDLKRAVQLVGAKSLLAAADQMSGLEPLVQLDVAALEYRSDRDRELTLARPTAPQPCAATLYRRNSIKAAAPRAKWSLGP